MSFRALDGVMCFSFSLALMCFVCVSIMNYEDFQKKATTKCQKKSNKERIKPDNENNENDENNDESREE